MIKKRFGITLSIILLCAFIAKADVPPLPGLGRVKTDLVLETKEDLSDYRFFLDFYGDLKEIKVNNNSQTTIPSVGGGARYADGTLLAIPGKNLNQFADDSPTSLKNLSQALREKKVEGVIELTKHKFIKDTLLGLTLAKPFYTIEREANTLKIVQTSELNKTVIIAGILIAAAIFLFGFFLFRKASKKV